MLSADNIANSFEPDQDRHNVGPDLDPKLYDTLIVFLKEFFEKVKRHLKKFPWFIFR